MLNYVKSELYKTVRRKYFWWLLLICSALGVGVNVLLFFMAHSTDMINGTLDATFSLAMVGAMAMSVSYVCPLMMTDIVFSEEYKHQTMKNSVSYGFSRSEIFFGKFIAEFIVSIVALVVIFGAFTASAFLLLGSTDAAVTAEITHVYFVRLFLMLPLWIWSLALSHTIVFFVRNNTFFALASVGVLMILPMVFNNYIVYVWPEFVAAVSPWLAFTKMTALTSNNFVIDNFGMLSLEYWSAGLIRAVVVLALGVFLFRRKEIK